MGTIVMRAGRYQAKVRVSGFPPTSKTWRTREDAEQWIQRTEAAMRAGVFTEETATTTGTVADLIVRYQRTKGFPPASPMAYRLNALKRLPLAKLAPQYLTPGVVAAYRDKRLKAGIASSTVNRELTVLSSVLSTAISEWGLGLTANPVQLIAKPANPPHRERRFKPGEEQALLQEAARAQGKGNGVYLDSVVILALETAMRLGELVNLPWSMVDLDKRQIRLFPSPGFSVKNGKPRTIPLSSAALNVLALWKSRRDETGRVFPGITESGVKQSFRRAAARAGLADFHFHDLRHEATSRLFERGFNIAEVRAINGDSLQSLQRYVQLDVSAMADRMDQPLNRH